MNPIDHEGPTSILYCPSCAARVEQDASTGGMLRCPVCGTEFKSESTESTENAVTQADRTVSDEPTRRLSTEDILLERLKNEPPEKKPIGLGKFAIIFAAVLAISFGIVRITSKPDTYAPGHEVDTTMLLQKRMFFQHIVDSLHNVLAQNPSNIDIHLSLADALYDESNWEDSKKEFETYLTAKPTDADARVDYAYAIAQDNGDLNHAIAEIDTALRYHPDHLNALINAGIMTAQTVTDTNHATALARAKDYFERAKAVAQKTNPEIALRIDTLIQEIDKTGQRMAK